MTSIRYFPMPYPDELLYSTIARYHRHMGGTNNQITLRTIFNQGAVVISTDLPSRIGEIVEKTPIGKYFTAENLLLQQTLYPFYSTFIGNSRRKQLEQKMLKNTQSQEYRLGVIASTAISIPSQLRFCPDCIREDLEEFGEPFWHRVHQVPGVYVCPHHELYLQSACITCGTQFQGNVKECICLDHTCSNGHDLTNKNPESVKCAYTFKRLIEYSREVFDILHRTDCYETSELHNRYIDRLQYLGFAFPSGKVNREPLENAFLDYYGQEFLQLLQSELSKNASTNWLLNHLMHDNKSKHPLRNILLIKFLFGSIKEFAETRNQRFFQPFGREPWPCLNPAAKHYKESLITQYKVSKQTKGNKSLIGTFSCECGFTYTRYGPDENEDDRNRIDYINNFGEEWERKFRRLKYEEKLPHHIIAEKLGITRQRVDNCVKRINKRGVIKLKKSNMARSKVNEYKEIVLQFIQEKEGKTTRQEISRVFPRAVLSIRRCDPEWFEQNMPTPMSRRDVGAIIQQNIDWNSRDTELVKIINEAAKSIKNRNDRPVRVTLSRLINVTGRKTDLQRNLDKLPNAVEAIESVLESLEEILIRKIRWAANILREKGEKVTMSSLIKLVRIRGGMSKKLQEIMDQEIGNSNGEEEYT